jgi:hypothetical protein
MAQKRWGDSAVYEVLRDGEPLTITVYLRRQPPGNAAADPEAGEEPAPDSMPPHAMPPHGAHGEAPHGGHGEKPHAEEESR